MGFTIHGVQYYQNGTWINAPMDGDPGEDFIILPTVVVGSQYPLRVYDASNQPINNARIYNFLYPASAARRVMAPTPSSPIYFQLDQAPLLQAGPWFKLTFGQRTCPLQ